MNSDSKFNPTREVEAIEAIRVELERLEYKCITISLAHKHTGRRWSSIYLWLGIPNAILAGISGCTAFSSFEYSKNITGILSIMVASLASLNIFLDPSKKAGNHLIASNKYNQLADKARKPILFLRNKNNDTFDLIKGNISAQLIAQEYEFLLSEIQKLGSESPILPKWAIKEAKKVKDILIMGSDGVEIKGSKVDVELTAAIQASQDFNKA